MFNLIYASGDPTNHDGAETWALARGIPLTTCRVLREIDVRPGSALVVDWEYCLDRDRFDAVLADLAGRVPLAVHGYHFDDQERQHWQSLGVHVCRYLADALDAVSIALAQVA